MAGERTGRQPLGITPSHRRRLSNITNLVNGSSWSNENEVVKSMYSTYELQLQQEIKKLEQINVEKDLIIAEKDQEIESQKLFLHKMQRDFYTNICKRSLQNEEIIGFNTRLSKDLSSIRDQLKLLQHEYTQMTIVYKVNESELQMRLAETQVQLKRACEEKKEKASYESVNTDENPTTTTRRTRNSSARRHSMTLGVGLEPDIWNPSTNTHSTSCLDTTSVTMRGGARHKASALPQKDSSLKLKIRQHDCASMPILEPYFPDPVPACSTKRYNNRYGHLNNLEPMQEVEECESQTSSSTSHTRGNPSLESLSTEVTGSKSTASKESGINGQQDGEAASISECNGPGASKSSEPRLASRVHKNPSEKDPLPARSNSPQRRAASQPSSPRKRIEAHLAIQRKAASQPTTPRSTSPVRPADSLPTSRSSLSRTQSSSVCSLNEPDQAQGQPPSRMSVGGRPTRRASVGVVSYKEPSLVSKMRRPR